MGSWRDRVTLVALLIAVVMLGRSDMADGLHRIITDIHFRWRVAADPAPFPDRIVVVAVDDATVADPAYGRLRNWSRGTYARLLDRLALADAVGLDILFVDADRVDMAGDRALVEAVARHGRVVLAFNTFGGVPRISDSDQQQLKALSAKFPSAGAGAGWPLSQAVMSWRLDPPLADLVGAAAALGFADVEADHDGVYRRPSQVKVTEEGAVLPHFATAVAAVASGTALREALVGAPHRLDFGGPEVPLVNGRIWIRPLARRAAVPSGLGKPPPTISFAEAMRTDPEFFRGKIVLVGETATGTTDKRPNPLDPGLCGVELNAEILANLLYLLPAERLPIGLEFALVAMSVVPPVWFFLGLPVRRALALAAVLAVVLVIALEGVFWIGRYVPAWPPVLIGVVGATLVAGLQRLGFEEKRKAELRRSFSMYLPAEVVDQIADDPSLAAEQGVRGVVCVLFSDIRGFTSYCERNEPERVVAQLSEYLTSMTESVDACRGVLDKFIGDAVMALFGPFLEDGQNPCALGCVCALDMQARLRALNAEWAERGWDQLKIGIGLHFGEAIVGNIGSNRRMQYTAVGDTVNAASRLEAATKDVGEPVLVTEEVRNEAAAVLGERVTFEPRGTFEVRNRAQPMTVWSLSPATPSPEGVRPDEN